MSGHPHQMNLRLGRWSELGKAYSITKCSCEGISIAGDSSVPSIIINSLLWMDNNERLILGSFVVMPNHYHAVFVLKGGDLRDIMKSIGSFTAREINMKLGKSGQVWQEGYYDRAIRRDEDIREIFDYIHNNPVRRGLVRYAEEWPHSSLNRGYFEKIRWHFFA